MSEALVRSLNLPAVQVRKPMARNGLRQSYAMLDCRYFAQRCCAESFTHSRRRWCKTEDMAAAYTAFARHGKAGKLPYSLTIRCLNGL